jgi:uncharacterized protein
MSLTPSNLCVADTGVLIELSRLGYLETLQELFDKVLASPAVFLELQTVVAPEWLELSHPSQNILDMVNSETNLGQGESEALAVALELKAWVLLDDRKARRYAKNKGISSIGTLGLLILIHQNSWAQRSAQEDLDLLAKGLWVTTELLNAALQEMTELSRK